MTSADVAAYIGRWRPSSVSAQAAAFARDVITKTGPQGRERAKNLLWAAGKLADYALGPGLGAAPEVLLHPSVTERFTRCAPGLSGVARRTLRTNLRFIGRRVVPQLYPQDLPLPRERAKEPYSLAEIDGFLALADAQPTAERRMRAAGLVCLGAGAGDRELELSYSVEASADLGLLVPSLRAESFHSALYESTNLVGKAITAGRMLQRLSSAIGAELTAIESIERRADDNRRVRYAVAVGFVSAVAIPASLILAYLGINASQVDAHRFMFSQHYLGMYLTVGAVIVLGAVVSLALNVRQRREPLVHRSPAQRPRWTPVPEDPDT